MVIRAEHLAALNLVLDANPELQAAILAKLDQAVMGLNELRTAIGPQPMVTKEQTPSTDKPQAPKTADECKAAILTWFESHPGKHRLNEIRKDLGVAETSKPFKTAVVQLQAEKKIKGTGKRGIGAEYWT